VTVGWGILCCGGEWFFLPQSARRRHGDHRGELVRIDVAVFNGLMAFGLGWLSVFWTKAFIAITKG
jgi:hypothetical protein